MFNIKSHIRSLVLPVAILMGFIFHTYCGMLYRIVPYTVFTMLFLSYSAIDVKKMAPSWLDVWLMLFQIIISIGLYLIANQLFSNEAIAEGLLIGVLTPVAASVVVISCALGANRERVTTNTILCNFMVAIVAPVYFSFIGKHQDMPFWISFWNIFRRITPQIVFPFLCVLFLQRFLPKVNGFFCKYKGTSLYIWAITLTIVLGKTFHDIIITPNPDWNVIFWMCILAVILCFSQFFIGKKIGEHYNEKIAGGQLLAQKNTSFGIWLAVEYLNNPLSALFPAIYSVCQNIYNSWQMYQHDKNNEQET